MLPHWTEHDITVNGMKIHYTRTGAGEKPALVLCHGFSDAGLCWLPVACDLEADHDVIMPDARGHGQSQRLVIGEVFDHAADLAGLIQALGLQGPIVGGHSMGGSTASSLAARFPGLARALILEDPGWRDWAPPKEEEKKEPQRNPWFEWLRSLPGMSMEAVMAKCRADSPTWAEAEIYPWALSKKQLDLNVLEARGAWMDWREQARGISVPALLITADSEKGAIVTTEGAAEAQRLSSCIQVAHVPGAGHNIRRENYPAFLQAVRAFLAGL